MNAHIRSLFSTLSNREDAVDVQACFYLVCCVLDTRFVLMTAGSLTCNSGAVPGLPVNFAVNHSADSCAIRRSIRTASAARPPVETFEVCRAASVLIVDARVGGTPFFNQVEQLDHRHIAFDPLILRVLQSLCHKHTHTYQNRTGSE